MRSYVFGIALVGALALESAHSAFEEISSVANYCSDYRNLIKLNEDRTILCFDGPLVPDRNTTAFHELKQNGFFVVRSTGGYEPTAIELANILLKKNATVIIYDFCLSACANYLLIASSKTYVLKHAIVAWHGGPEKRRCTVELTERLRKYHADSIERLRKYYIEHYRYPQAAESVLSPEWICKGGESSKAFFKQRGIDDRHIYEPQTAYTKKFFNFSVKQGSNEKNIFWMWNPRNYGEYFKSIITYESYPSDQAEVDEILTRAGLRVRVFYDPPK